MKKTGLGVVILAAGKGTRMKSDLPKVLHKVNNRPMIEYVAESAVALAGESVYIVVGHQAEKVKKEVSRRFNVKYVLQENLLGTGDAVKEALPLLDGDINRVLVMCGDVPLIREKTLRQLIDSHERDNNTLTVLAAQVANPTGYGRIILDDAGRITCIREEADADEWEKSVKLVNTGIFCFDKGFLEQVIPMIKSENKQKEYYLTDAIEIAGKKGRKPGVVKADNADEMMGINTCEQLIQAEKLLKTFD
ncbi:MAG: sugar phosphate nucleotidyltransferase [Desulfobacteraceae bacterium]